MSLVFPSPSIAKSNLIFVSYIKFGCYNEAVIKFLLGLNEAICQQIKFLSLTNISDDEWEKVSNECRQQKRSNSQLINIIMRFRNLSTLIMLVPGVSDLDTQYLFENCTKLNRIEFCHYTWGHDNIFYDLKENCKQIQFIRVVGPRNKITKPQNDLQKLFPGVKMQVRNFQRNLRSSSKLKFKRFHCFSSITVHRSSKNIMMGMAILIYYI